MAPTDWDWLTKKIAVLYRLQKKRKTLIPVVPTDVIGGAFEMMCYMGTIFVAFASYFVSLRF